jgi:low density lipoprotein receptor-related protein 5/6
MKLRLFSLLATALAILSEPLPSWALGSLYFTNRESIEVADTNGGSRATVIPGLTNVRRLKIAGSKLYWVQTSAPSRILRANLDGTNVETVVNTTFTAFAFDVDAPGGKVYYAVQSEILRSNLDGTGIESLAAVNINPGGLALDLAAGKMYWTLVSTGLVQRSNLNGTNVETLVSGVGNPNGLVLDVAGGKLYWTDLFVTPDVVRRANLDGSSVETIISGADAEGADAITIDPGEHKLYYLSVTGVLRRSNLDGSNVETLLTASDMSTLFRGLAFTTDLPVPVREVSWASLKLRYR